MFERYDENGVFALCCGRHGVPYKMYDIYEGEGRKYALAAVNEVLKMTGENQPIGLMYDIVCLCQKKFE
ncbi:hypothetical protein ABG067_007982, partial [Albugo candida]